MAFPGPHSGRATRFDLVAIKCKSYDGFTTGSLVLATAWRVYSMEVVNMLFVTDGFLVGRCAQAV